MKFIVGIGNPGKQYDGTRHNIGFMAVEAMNKGGLAVQWTAKDKLKAQIAKTGDQALLMKPSTFVNLSGQCVAITAKKYQSAPKDFLIVCDDVNLAFGKIRFRESGSAGGHHGLESIIESLGSDEFPRLRIGVGNEIMPKDLASFVLEKFLAEEKKELPKILEKAVLVCEAWEKKGFESARDLLSRLQSVKEKGE